MVLSGFERRMERMVEGAFARVFRSGLRPVELGRRLARAMDDGRSIDVRGRTIAPNSFLVHLSPEDHQRFAEVAETLLRELGDAAREHARDEAYHFLGPVEVELTADERYRTGTFAIDAHYHEAAGGAGAGSLVLPDGTRLPLDGRVHTIGRHSSCDIAIADANVSRQHAEIRPVGEHYVVVDLASTNGTKVNGERIAEHALLDGDQITIGTTTFTFEES